MRGVICEIELPEGGVLKLGKPREELCQLEGRAYTGASATPWSMNPMANTDDRAKVEWVVQAPAGSVVQITARHERAGTVRAALTLGPGPA